MHHPGVRAYMSRSTHVAASLLNCGRHAGPGLRDTNSIQKVDTAV